MRRFARTPAVALVGLGISAGFAGLTGVADGRRSEAYWSTAKAERALVKRYQARTGPAAHCTGWGRSARIANGRRGYRHFICAVSWNEPGTGDGFPAVSGELRVRGKRQYTFEP